MLCHAGSVPDELLAAFAAIGMPVRAQPLPETLWSLFERALVLVRPDGHVAWRGDEAPQDPAKLADLVRGSRRAT